MLYLRLLAFDPGETTGVGLADEKGKYHAWTIKTPKETYDEIIRIKPDVVLCECFVYTGYANPHKTYTVKLIGGIEAICSMMQIPIVFQRPYERYPHLADAKQFLQQRGDKYTQHEIDALSHIYTYETRNVCMKASSKNTSKVGRR